MRSWCNYSCCRADAGFWGKNVLAEQLSVSLVRHEAQSAAWGVWILGMFAGQCWASISRTMEPCPLFPSQILQLWDLLSCGENLGQVLVSVSWKSGLWPSVFKCATADLACVICVLRTWFWNAFPQLLLRHFIFQTRNIAGSQFSKPSLSHTALHHILNCNDSTDLKVLWAHTQLAVHAKLFSWARTVRRINPELNWGLARFYFLELSCFLLLFSLKKPKPTALQEFILQHKKRYIFLYSAITQ